MKQIFEAYARASLEFQAGGTASELDEAIIYAYERIKLLEAQIKRGHERRGRLKERIEALEAML